MKVTSIKQQERLKDRYSVFVDDAYAFSLSERALLESKLASGIELNAAQLQSYKQLSADDKLYGRVLRWVASRLRSSWEIRQYLQRKDATPALADELMQKLERLGFVDDREFARAWVESRRQLKPTSARKLRMELQAKRISDEIIHAALSGELDEHGDNQPVDDRAALQEIIARKRRQLKYRDDEKLMQYLARQGFGYDDIKSALQNSA